MISFSYCLYYSFDSYYANQPDRTGLGQARTPEVLIERVMRKYQLPSVAYAVVSPCRGMGKPLLFVSCTSDFLGFHWFRYALRQEL